MLCGLILYVFLINCVQSAICLVSGTYSRLYLRSAVISHPRVSLFFVSCIFYMCLFVRFPYLFGLISHSLVVCLTWGLLNFGGRLIYFQSCFVCGLGVFSEQSV